MNTNIDYTSTSTQYTFDVNESHLFVKDNQNLINVLGKNQLNTLEGSSLLDIYLSASNIIEPHYHPNAAELVYCISGAITISILNPFTNKLSNFPIAPGQVVNVPRAWWHYEVATKNDTHILAIFDAPNPEVILASDILRFTPSNIMAQTYCLNEKEWKDVTKPIKSSTYIGPYKECNEDKYSPRQSYNPIYQDQYLYSQNETYQYPYNT